MSRTARAATLSFVIAMAAVTIVGWALGFDLVPALVAGAVFGAAAAALLVGASQRAGVEHAQPPNEQLLEDPTRPLPGERPPPEPDHDDGPPDHRGTT